MAGQLSRRESGLRPWWNELPLANMRQEREEDRHYHRIERRRGSFRRALRLPATVQEDQVDASFRDGVLTVKMPKAEESKPKKISVKG